MEKIIERMQQLRDYEKSQLFILIDIPSDEITQVFEKTENPGAWRWKRESATEEKLKQLCKAGFIPSVGKVLNGYQIVVEIPRDKADTNFNIIDLREIQITT